MNPPQIIKHIKKQIISLLAEEVSSHYSWYNLVFITKAIQLKQINWSECDYYQSMSGKDKHLHAYGTCEVFQAKKITLNGQNRVQQLDQLYTDFTQQCLFVNEISIPLNSCPNNPQPNNTCPNKSVPLAYCQVAFDQGDKMSGIWQGFDNAKLIIPQILFLHQAHQTQISISIKKNINRQDKTQLEDILSILQNILIKNNTKQNQPASESLLEQANISIKYKSKIQTEQRYCEKQSKEHWKQQINNIKIQLQSNKVSKIVLARQVNYQFSHKLKIKQLIETLLTTYPDCTIMMLKSEHSYLIACSPELLVKVSNQEVYCDTVGGTINNDQSEVQNTKLKHEHIIIREHIYGILKAYCHNIHFSEQPSIKNYLHLSHLYTHFSATTKENLSVLQMADLLHPTPAVCGIPVNQAKNWIIHNETFNRGLYSGFSGWLNALGEGEMNVILRCAVLKKQRVKQQGDKKQTAKQKFTATFFTGAGIVNGSLEEEEWQETELKLKMLLHSIQQVYQ